MVRDTELTLLSGMLLDEDLDLGLGELCRVCNVHAELVMEMAEEGLIVPLGAQAQEWRFAGIDVRRVQIALRLQRDLGVNVPGAALAVELLEELEELRRLQHGDWEEPNA